LGLCGSLTTLRLSGRLASEAVSWGTVPDMSGGAERTMALRVGAGLLAGAGAGSLCNLFLGGHPALEWGISHLSEPAGTIWLRTLMMVVLPLVFGSLALGVAGLGNLAKLGRIGGRTLLMFLSLTAVSVVLGLLVVNLLQPGADIPPETRDRLLAAYADETAAKAQAARGLELGVQTLVDIVPRNPVAAMADFHLLAVIFFALMFGVALGLMPRERAEPMIRFLDSLVGVSTTIIDLVMRLAPYGVFCLMFTVTGRFGYDLLAKLGLYVLAVLLAMALQFGGVYPAIVRLLGARSPRTFFRQARTILLTAFSTSSSSATLPTTLKITEEELGVSREVCGFVLPLGATLNMNGTALFEGVTVLFIAQVFGVSLDLNAQVMVLVVCVLSAVGAAGTPSSSIPLLVVILTSLGIPGEGIAIILGVDRLLDMCRTTLNVAGDVVTAVVIDRFEGTAAGRNPVGSPGPR